MSWWLLGVSMVATTFSADTPNLVSGFVRKDGVAGNWAWWAFLLTGMLTVFMYAKLWRRAGILTDLEFYEMRYSGKIAVFLRGFRALYLGIILNVLIMATNAPRLPAGFADWTAWLLANPLDLSPTRRYTFYLGTNMADGSGLSTVMNPDPNVPLATPCTTTTANCFVNLNTISTSSTAPAVAVTGQNNNATGGPIGIALAVIARFRPDQTVEETSRIGSIGNSLYQGLVLEMRSRYRQLGKGFAGSFPFRLHTLEH